MSTLQVYNISDLSVHGQGANFGRVCINITFSACTACGVKHMRKDMKKCIACNSKSKGGSNMEVDAILHEVSTHLPETTRKAQSRVLIVLNGEPLSQREDELCHLILSLSAMHLDTLIVTDGARNNRGLWYATFVSVTPAFDYNKCTVNWAMVSEVILPYPFKNVKQTPEAFNNIVSRHEQLRDNLFIQAPHPVPLELCDKLMGLNGHYRLTIGVPDEEEEK